jgi:hypothetical protein
LSVEPGAVEEYREPVDEMVDPRDLLNSLTATSESEALFVST